MARLRDRLEAGLRAIAPEAVIFGANATRLPNTTLVALPGGKAETLVIAFDLDGVAVSSGVGLLLRQGRALARAGRDGRGTGARARRDPDQYRPGDDRGRDRPFPECLAKAQQIPI